MTKRSCVNIIFLIYASFIVKLVIMSGALHCGALVPLAGAAVYSALCIYLFFVLKKDVFFYYKLLLVICAILGVVLLTVFNIVPRSTVIEPYFRLSSLLFLIDLPFIALVFFKEIRFTAKSWLRIACVAAALTALLTSIIIPDSSSYMPVVSAENEGLYARSAVSCSEYTASAKGTSVVVVELPSFITAMLSESGGEPPAPRLNEFLNSTVRFDNFYAEMQDTDFISMNSLYPLLAGSTPFEYLENTYNGLPSVMGEHGYSSSLITSKPKELNNLDEFACAWGFDKVISCASDADAYMLARKAVAGGKKLVYVDTSTSEYPYGNPEQPLTVQTVLDAVAEADRLFGEFIDSLSKNVTVIVYGYPTDISIHEGRMLSALSAAVGEKLNGLDSYNSVLAFRIPHVKPAVFNNLCSAYDIFPAVLDLLGMNDADDLMLYGDTPFTGKDDDIICFQNKCVRGSFVNDKYVYLKLTNGNDQIFNYQDMSYGRTADCLSDAKRAISIISEAEELLAINYFKYKSRNGKAEALSLLRSNLSEKDGITLIYQGAKTDDDGSYVPGYNCTVTTKLISAGQFGGRADGARLSYNGWTAVGGNKLGRVVSAAHTINGAAWIEPYVNCIGTADLYISVSIDNGKFTGYYKQSESFEDEQIRIQNGILYSKTGKITGFAFCLDIDKGASVSSIAVANDGKADNSYIKNGAYFMELEPSAGIENAVKSILKYYKNTAPAYEITDGAEAMQALSANNTCVFKDTFNHGALRNALSLDIPVLCNGDKGWFLTVGYSDGEYTVSINNSFEKLTQREINKIWNGEVIIAMDNDPDLIIIEDFIPLSSVIRPGYVVNDKQFIVIHNTGNYDSGSDAKAHGAYLHNQAASSTPREASWHYTVDDKLVYYHVPDNESAWHASDGTFGNGNYYGIGIEICVNGFPETYNGELYEEWLETFKLTLDNAAKLTARLLKKYGLDMSAIMQHNDFAPDKKNCPMQMRYNSKTEAFDRDNGDMWIYFLDKVKGYYG